MSSKPKTANNLNPNPQPTPTPRPEPIYHFRALGHLQTACGVVIGLDRPGDVHTAPVWFQVTCPACQDAQLAAVRPQGDPQPVPPVENAPSGQPEGKAAPFDGHPDDQPGPISERQSQPIKLMVGPAFNFELGEPFCVLAVDGQQFALSPDVVEKFGASCIKAAAYAIQDAVLLKVLIQGVGMDEQTAGQAIVILRRQATELAKDDRIVTLLDQWRM